MPPHGQIVMTSQSKLIIFLIHPFGECGIICIFISPNYLKLELHSNHSSQAIHYIVVDGDILQGSNGTNPSG
jgi:hypothetical protein